MSNLYLITRLDSIHAISVVLSIMSFVALLVTIGLIYLNLSKSSSECFKITLVTFIISILMYILIPSTNDMLTILGL